MTRCVSCGRSPRPGHNHPVDEHSDDAGQSSDNGGGHGPTNGDLPVRLHPLRDFLNEFFARSDDPGARVDGHELAAAYQAHRGSRQHTITERSAFYSDLRLHFNLAVRRLHSNRQYVLGIVARPHAAPHLQRLLGLADAPDPTLFAGVAPDPLGGGAPGAGAEGPLEANDVDVVMEPVSLDTYRNPTARITAEVHQLARTLSAQVMEELLPQAREVIAQAFESNDWANRRWAAELVLARTVPKLAVRAVPPEDSAVATESSDRRNLRAEIESLIGARNGSEG
jgi:hypothetical protein